MDYKPIDCGIYDQLILWQMHHKKVLVSLPDDKESLNIFGIIEDIYTLNGIEYLRMEDTRVFRLDEIVVTLALD